jgi:glycosyltransferase involved in cell wall biosynthesis
LLADTAEAFAGQVVRLLRDRDLCTRIANEARSFVESRHTWERSVDELEEIYHSLLATTAHNA